MKLCNGTVYIHGMELSNAEEINITEENNFVDDSAETKILLPKKEYSFEIKISRIGARTYYKVIFGVQDNNWLRLHGGFAMRYKQLEKCKRFQRKEKRK